MKIKSSCRATQWRLSERWFNEALTMAGRTRPDIVRRYEDALGNWRDAPKQTVAAVAAAMGQPPPGKRRIGHGGTSRPTEKIARSGGTDLEDGAILRCENTLPGDLPNGYHRLRYLSDDCDSNLIVSPGVCYLPDP